MYRHEIMCTGNTAQITFKCFYSLKTARNFVRDVIIRTLVPKFVRILTQLSPSILLRFSGKKRYEGVRFDVISVTRGWVGVQFPEKKRYVGERA